MEKEQDITPKTNHTGDETSKKIRYRLNETHRGSQKSKGLNDLGENGSSGKINEKSSHNKSNGKLSDFSPLFSSSG